LDIKNGYILQPAVRCRHNDYVNLTRNPITNSNDPKLICRIKLFIMDNKTNTGKADESRININESYELQYWSEKLNVSRDQLREAVEAVGPSAEKVTEYLKEQ